MAGGTQVMGEATGTHEALTVCAVFQTAGTNRFLALLATVQAAATKRLITGRAIAGAIRADRLFAVVAAIRLFRIDGRPTAAARRAVPTVQFHISLTLRVGVQQP